MERSKVKNVIIVILLAVNIALLGLLLRDVLGQRRSDEMAMDSLHEALNGVGIELQAEDILYAQDICLLHAARDSEQEAELAQKLLGECSMEDQGGNIHRYYNGSGEIIFRGNGDFEAVFNGSIQLGEVLSVLEKKGVEFDIPQDAQGEYTCLQKIQGYDLLDSTVTLSVNDGAPTSLEGRWLVSSVTEDTDDMMIDAATALMRFAAANRERELGCTRIIAADVGYYMTAQVTGEFDLEPVWVIETDVGSFRVNGIKSGVEQLKV